MRRGGIGEVVCRSHPGQKAVSYLRLYLHAASH